MVRNPDETFGRFKDSSGNICGLGNTLEYPFIYF